jgi:hypothetical protein
MACQIKVFGLFAFGKEREQPEQARTMFKHLNSPTC